MNHLHPADDSGEVQPAAEVIIQLEYMKPPAGNGNYITAEGRSEYYFSVTRLIHQGAAEFGYEMCILVSILLLIMKHYMRLWAGLLFSFACLLFSLHALYTC